MSIFQRNRAQLVHPKRDNPLAVAERDIGCLEAMAAGSKKARDTSNDGVPKIEVVPATTVKTEDRTIFPGPQISPKEQAEIKKSDLKK